ncbi:MAG TPA: TPM domain-containing protein, partial [Chitinophagaceae bacterium]|nr:TPM domain-containing protein [Chitinophagaceae bacterium]
MKKFLLLFSLFCNLFVLGQGINSVVPPRPNPPRLVNDFGNVLTPEQEQALEAKLVAYDDSTSNQVAVVTIPTTGDYAIQEVGLAILRQWGVGGQAKKDNGIVLLIAVNDRGVNISTGYGMEGSVPDITANQIIQNDIVPQFKAGNY